MPYINLFSLNGVEFTDQGRTVSENLEQRSVNVQLASGRIKKYVMGNKKRWSVSWEWLPQDQSLTADGKGARNELKSLAFTGNTYTLLMRDSVGQTNVYVVFIEAYNESLIRRDMINNQFFYNVSLELMEQ